MFLRRGSWRVCNKNEINRNLKYVRFHLILFLYVNCNKHGICQIATFYLMK